MALILRKDVIFKKYLPTYYNSRPKTKVTSVQYG